MINISQLSMRFGGKILFSDVSIQFNPGNHYGLIGANGCGKSTFIQILSGDLEPEAGSFTYPSQLSLGSLKQDHYLYENEDVIDVVLRGKKRLWGALEKKKALLQKEHHTNEDYDLLGDLEQIFDQEDGYAAEGEAAKLLEGLGIREEAHRKPLHLLSGGYKLRVLLAQLFFGKPDILVLDEPTNHLDLYSIKWLEGYLRNFPGTLLVTSHDRDFLNGICTHIADVDYGTIRIYKGNYDAFVEQKLVAREQNEHLLSKQEKKKEDLQLFINRFKAKASKATQAQSKARLVDKIEEEMENLDLTPSSRIYPKISFDPLRASGVTVLEAKGISKSYGPKTVLQNVSFEIERGERIAIIGPNGVGKSTLLEILTDHTKLDGGSFTWGFAARIAYFPQDHAREVQGNYSLLDWLGKWDTAAKQEKLREILARVLFSGDTVGQSIHTLSGGEKARLILAKMMLLKPNILIFDEPTNHLDIEAIEALAESLQSYEGTILFVSHNRYFVSHVANRILEVTTKGVQDFKCTYAEYLEKQERDHLSSNAPLSQRYGTEKKKESQPAISYEEQKRLKNMRAQLKKKVSQAEEETHKIETKIREIEEIMGTEKFYHEATLAEQNKYQQQRYEWEQKLAAAIQKWEDASVEMQKAEDGICQPA